MKTQNILITGGCGFIGTSLLTRLLELDQNVTIRILDNFTTGTPEDLSSVCHFVEQAPQDEILKGKVSLIHGDIRDQETAVKISKHADVIVHLAANTGVGPSVEDPRLDMDCNVVGTFNMLEAARINKVQKFIFASSGAPAGEVEPPIHEELPPHPVSPYGASKLAGEGYCSAYSKTFGVDTICLRFGNVYGPRSKKKSSVVAKFIRQALAGEECTIYGDGNQTRDFIYIDDLVQAVILSIESNIGGETFQIATGSEHSVLEIVTIIKKALVKKNIQMRISHDSPRLGDVKRNFSDTTKARTILAWHAQMSIESGIDRTIEYFMGL